MLSLKDENAKTIDKNTKITSENTKTIGKNAKITSKNAKTIGKNAKTNSENIKINVVENSTVKSSNIVEVETSQITTKGEIDTTYNNSMVVDKQPVMGCKIDKVEILGKNI